MKKIFTLFFACFVCAVVTMPSVAAPVKSGRCDIHKADKLATVKTLGSVIGGGIGWATGGAVGASLAPFGLIGRGGIDPVVGTLKINGTILAGFVGGAAVGSFAGGKIASSVYAADDYLCFDNDINKCLQCDVHEAGDAYECGDFHVVIGPNFVKRCNATRRPFGKDEWVNFTIPKCSGGKEIRGGHVVEEIKTSSWKDLSAQGASGWLLVDSRGLCYSVECDTGNGWEYDSVNKVCKEKAASNPNPQPDPGNKKTCRELRAGLSPEAIACCDTGNLAEWTGTECKCKNPKTEFKIDGNGTGKCIPKADNDEPVNPPVQPVPSKDCPSDAYPSDDNKTCICDDKTNMKYNESKKICECIVKGTEKIGGECKCTAEHKELKNGKCEWSEAYLASIKIEIDKYYSKLTEIGASLKVSEWRDAEGEFNTARLASDSIAGVVLGTVGGVVTSHLVKKAQVKQGFEDLQCYIGGQSVADWGDGFVVGR